jgi:hypothetical protein
MFSRHRLAALLVLLIAAVHVGGGCPQLWPSRLARCLEAQGAAVSSLLMRSASRATRLPASKLSPRSLRYGTM